MPTHTGHVGKSAGNLRGLFSLSTTWALGIKSTESSHQTVIIDVLTGTVGLEIKPLLYPTTWTAALESVSLCVVQKSIWKGEKGSSCV